MAVYTTFAVVTVGVCEVRDAAKVLQCPGWPPPESDGGGANVHGAKVERPCPWGAPGTHRRCGVPGLAVLQAL